MISMKLFFEENLSPKLPNRLSDLSLNSLHVQDVGIQATTDSVAIVLKVKRKEENF